MHNLKALVRIDHRTKNLVRRLRPGEIAIINHPDLDSVAAESLVACAPAAVVNASESISGRYPNIGPGLLLRAGIPVLDHVGPEVMTWREGESSVLNLETGELRNGVRAVRGTVLTPELVAARSAAARANLSGELRRFVENTLQFVTREEHVLLDLFGGLKSLQLRTRIGGRHTLIVVRGEGYREDLAVVRAYIDEMHPVLIAVDGGADALREQRRQPHIIIGDMDSVSDDALRCGAELLVHAYSDGRSPGADRLRALGLQFQTIAATGTSEDIAMLLAFEHDAELIVAVGTHSTLIHFLDKGRHGMSSTFLTRLRIGSKLVDARGVSKLYQRKVQWYHVVWPSVVCIVIAALSAFIFSTGFRVIVNDLVREWILRRH